MADEKYIRIRIDGGNSRSTARKINNDVKGIGVSADGASDSMMRLSSVANAVITALATNQVLQYADSWTTVNNRLRQATKTADEFAAAQTGVIEIAQRASVGIEGVATAYSRLAQATSELDLSQERLLDLTNKLTLALKAGGATADETSSVMIQLAQGLGSGALQGDELRSILEASIPITKALAKEFNVTTGELKTLGSEGKITADRVVNAIENMDTSALSFTKTFSDGLTNVSNALTVYIGGIDESLGVTKFLGETLQSTAENIGLITDAVIALGVLFGARLVGSIASSTAALVAYTRGALYATVQTNAMGQVIARNTALMNAQALAARGVSSALALIGGPAGAAFIAAAAIVYFISQAESAEERSKRLADEVENLKTKYLDLNEAQRRIEIAKLNAQFKELQAELVAANKRLNQFKGFAESPVKREGVRQYTAEVERLNIELGKVSQKQQAAFGAGIDQINFTDATNQKPTSSGATKTDNSDFESRLQRERLLTQALEDEVDLRRALAAGEVNQRQFDEQNALNQVFYTYEQKRQAIIENETLNEEQRKQILDLYREQEILAEQQKLDAITNATQSATDERYAIQEAYNQSVQSLQMQTFSNATALLNSLNAESKLAALAGIAIQTATAFIANKAATASAATLAYSSQLIPGDPTSPVRAAAAAAKATTLGTINGGLILAAGAAKGLGALGGGGGGSPSSGGGGGSSSQFTPQRGLSQQAEAQKQKRIIDLRGFENGGYLTKQELTELLQSDDDVILASNNGQSNAQRTGLING